MLSIMEIFYVICFLSSLFLCDIILFGWDGGIERFLCMRNCSKDELKRNVRKLNNDQYTLLCVACLIIVMSTIALAYSVTCRIVGYIL